MVYKLEDIERQLMVGEDSRSEFKEIVISEKRRVQSPDTKAIADEMVAFANTDGGTIFLGVDDKGIVRGLPNKRLEDIEKWIINIATNNCSPPIRPILHREQLIRSDGTDAVIILVEIHRGLFVHATNSGLHYERIGSTKQILSGTRLARLFQKRERTFIFDERPVLTATLNDLDQGKLARYLDGPSQTIPWQDLLQNIKVISTSAGDVIRPTVAGILAFGKAPQNHLPSAYIEAAVYRNIHLTSHDLVHSDRIHGNAGEQIETAIKFVDRFMLKPAQKPVGRIDYPQYDIRTIREAIVNAVAHRDYSILGSKIRMFLFSDRIEIYSPGRLPNALTIDSMAYNVFTRNQLLVNFLSRMKSPTTGCAFLESRGEGVRLILSIGETHAGRSPVYKLYGTELVLTIWSKPSPHEINNPIIQD